MGKACVESALPAQATPDRQARQRWAENWGLWHDPPPRAPPSVAPLPQSVQAQPELDTADAVDMAPDFLEYLHRESMSDQIERPWA